MSNLTHKLVIQQSLPLSYDLVGLRYSYPRDEGSASFNYDILDLLARYDAADISSLHQDEAGTVAVTTDGQVVKRFDDLSGNGWHLSIPQADGNPPSYHETTNGVAFTGVNACTISNTTIVKPATLHVYGVVEPLTLVDADAIVNFSNTVGFDSNNSVRVRTGGKISYRSGPGGGNTEVDLLTSGAIAKHLMQFKYSSVSSLSWQIAGQSGSFDPTDTYTTNNGLVLAGVVRSNTSNTLHCRWHELILCNTAPSAELEESLLSHLESKWSVTR